MTENKNISEIIGYFPKELKQTFLNVSDGILKKLKEIRIRAGMPIMLFYGTEQGFLQTNGRVFPFPEGNPVITSSYEVGEIFRSLCEYSVHSFQEEIINGFVTIAGGHRVGVFGTVISEQNRVLGLKEISSLNIRIAREILGCAEEFYQKVFLGELCSVLIIGAPGTGKTTILRDLAKGLSSGRLGEYLKISIIDERGEIAAMKNGTACYQVGISTDVYHLCPKAQGMEMALRSGAPDVMICDEIGNSDDSKAILRSMLSGVKVIATTHAGSFQQVLHRDHIAYLIQQRAFEKLVLLKTGRQAGMIQQVSDAEYVLGEMAR